MSRVTGGVADMLDALLSTVKSNSHGFEIGVYVKCDGTAEFVTTDTRGHIIALRRMYTTADGTWRESDGQPAPGTPGERG